MRAGWIGESYHVDDAGDRIPIERVELLLARGHMTHVAAGHLLASYLRNFRLVRPCSISVSQHIAEGIF